MESENTIIKSEYVSYGFTVKYNKAKAETVDVADYSIWFSRAEKMGIKIECKYLEYDSNNHAHYHGVLCIPKKFYRKRLDLKGYHYKLEEIYDKAGWLRYCKKDQKKLSEVDTESSVPPLSPQRLYKKKLFKN